MEKVGRVGLVVLAMVALIIMPAMAEVAVFHNASDGFLENVQQYPTQSSPNQFFYGQIGDYACVGATSVEMRMIEVFNLTQQIPIGATILDAKFYVVSNWVDTYNLVQAHYGGNLSNVTTDGYCYGGSDIITSPCNSTYEDIVDMVDLVGYNFTVTNMVQQAIDSDGVLDILMVGSNETVANSEPCWYPFDYNGLIPYGGNESALYVEYTTYGTKINVQSPINDSYIFLGTDGFIWLNATPSNSWNVTIYCGVYLDNVLQYAGTGFNNSVVSYKTGVLSDGSHIAKFSCENSDGTYTDAIVNFRYLDNAVLKNLPFTNVTDGLYDMRTCNFGFQSYGSGYMWQACWANHTFYEGDYQYGTNCGCYSDVCNCYAIGMDNGVGSAVYSIHRTYATLNFSELPTNAEIIDVKMNFVENCFTNYSVDSYSYVGVPKIYGYYAGSSLPDINWEKQPYGTAWYVLNHTCDWNGLGGIPCNSPLLFNTSLINHNCNDDPYYDENFTEYSFDVTDLVNYAKERGSIGQIVFTGDEYEFAPVPAFWTTGGRIYPDNFEFVIQYAEPIPPVPSAMSVYASNITELGKGVGGFFYGLQFGVLNIILGLLFVGVIGMFFYAVFNILSTSVKEGFKK